jgi:hypothetical protein
MIDEVNTARDVCLLSINATLDGRLALYLSATGETVIARPGFAVILAYNPGLVGATDIPDAWHSRFPAALEVTSHWAALAQLGAPATLVREAATLDRQRIAGEDGLTWTPQFRDVESLWRMSQRVGERAALAFFASNLHEQVQAGKLQGAEAAACRMLDQAGYGRYRVRPSGSLPNLHGYARGDLVSAILRGGPPPFVQQLHRAAAQRGRLEPLYQDLSEQLTRILQRLYPVWALIGPGLSDPGHIELHSRWIYLDADELLGPREQLLAGAIPRRHVLRTFGVALHETFHGKHTKRWALERTIELARSDDPAERQLGADRRLLEEPRMEAHGCRELSPDSTRGRFTLRALQAAVVDVMLPRFAAELLMPALAGRPVTRDLAGRATVYLQARTHYGATDPGALIGLEPIWRGVLGDADLRALDALFARLIWIDDGDDDALDAAAREYRRIIGPPEPDDDDSGAPSETSNTGDGATAGNGDRGTAGEAER